MKMSGKNHNTSSGVNITSTSGFDVRLSYQRLHVLSEICRFYIYRRDNAPTLLSSLCMRSCKRVKRKQTCCKDLYDTNLQLHFYFLTIVSPALPQYVRHILLIIVSPQTVLFPRFPLLSQHLYKQRISPPLKVQLLQVGSRI